MKTRVWLVSFLLVFTMNFITVYTSKADSVDFPIGQSSVNLNDWIEVIVNNGKIESSVKLVQKDKGQILYEKDLLLQKVYKSYILENDGQQYIVLIYMIDGSANAIYFEVLKIGTNSIELFYISDVHENARIDVNSDLIKISYLLDENYDNSKLNMNYANPTIETQIYKFENNSIVKKEPVIEKQPKTIPFNFSELNNFTPNPSFKEINEILTEEALKAGVAPEIVKAIAFQESSWRQYWDEVPEYAKKCDIYDGSNVVIGFDCIGIGIMQISDYRFREDGPEKEEYIRRLKTDIRFNIQEGIEILKEKWNFHESGLIPTINDNNPMVIENWYFAILAYNGLLERNDPLKNPLTAYQEKVFQRMEEFTLISINPFPTYKLEPYIDSRGLLAFHNTNVEVEGPQHLSSQSLKSGETAYVTASSLNLRETPGGRVIGSLSKGTRVTITGKYVGHSSVYNHYVWLPVKVGNQTGWVASSYLTQSDNYIDVYPLYGKNRYETSVSVANHGWHWERPKAAVIGRGDLTIDALTGSVLAAKLDAPLLLTQTHRLTPIVEKELRRLNPEKIYILGGATSAIQPEVEARLVELFGRNNVIRVSGQNRYETATKIAELITNRPNEIFITTGDEKSSDPLAIAPYAGENQIPILLNGVNKLDKHVENYIKNYGVEKVTIIGGKVAISENVENQLKKLVGESNVERVRGSNRFETNTKIIDTYYGDNLNSASRILIAQGYDMADALTAAPLAARLKSPLILTLSDRVPLELSEWISTRISSKPNIYFLGGSAVIKDNVRNEFINLIK